jgi:mxaJ protein
MFRERSCRSSISFAAALAFACARPSLEVTDQPAHGSVTSGTALGERADETQPQSLPDGRRALRVCADPNNLPFSNRRLEGFENRIALLLAREMDADLEYTWWPQRRGFFRETLKAGRCDVVIGVPRQLDMVATTRPFYRSSYVFITPAGAPPVASLDDPALRTLRIGVHLIGDDYANSPPVHALSNRNVVDNVVGYRLLGDYSEENPPARLVEAVATGAVDVAIVWGPLGGYFAHRSVPPLAVRLVDASAEVPALPLTYEMTIGLRHGEPDRRAELDRILARTGDEIRAVLTEFHVPLLALKEDE